MARSSSHHFECGASTRGIIKLALIYKLNSTFELEPFALEIYSKNCAIAAKDLSEEFGHANSSSEVALRWEAI